MTTKEETFRRYQKDCKKAAKELGYPAYVQDLLDKCKTEIQLSNVLTTARKRAV